MSEPVAPGSVSQNRSIMIVLSYLWLLALVPLLVEKDDREVQWHAKNGLLLFGAEFVLGTLLSISSFVLHIFVFFYPFLWIGIIVLHILAIAKALKGERLVIPGLSEYADRV